MQTPLRYLALCLFISVVLSGCVSTSSDSVTKSASDIAANLDAFDQIELRMKQAQQADSNKEDLAWYASSDYRKAAKALDEAKEYYRKFSNNPAKMYDSGLFDSTSYAEYVSRALDKFEVAFQAAQDTKTTVLTIMATAFENKKVLEGLEAETHYASETKVLNRQFKRVVDQIASGKLGSIDKPLADLEEAQHKLEVKLVTKQFLTFAQKELERQKNAKYSLWAPVTLSRAEAEVQDAKTFIQVEPRNIEAIQQLTEMADFSLQRSERISLAVKRLRALEAKEQENYILELEAHFHKLAQAMALGDLRNLTLAEQALLLEDNVQQLLHQHQSAMDEVKISLNQSNSELESKYEALVHEHKLTKLQNVEFAAALSLVRKQLADLTAKAKPLFPAQTIQATSTAAKTTEAKPTLPKVDEAQPEVKDSKPSMPKVAELEPGVGKSDPAPSLAKEAAPEVEEEKAVPIKESLPPADTVTEEVTAPAK